MDFCQILLSRPMRAWVWVLKTVFSYSCVNFSSNSNIWVVGSWLPHHRPFGPTKWPSLQCPFPNVHVCFLFIFLFHFMTTEHVKVMLSISWLSQLTGWKFPQPAKSTCYLHYHSVTTLTPLTNTIPFPFLKVHFHIVLSQIELAQWEGEIN